MEGAKLARSDARTGAVILAGDTRESKSTHKAAFCEHGAGSVSIRSEKSPDCDSSIGMRRDTVAHVASRTAKARPDTIQDPRRPRRLHPPAS